MTRLDINNIIAYMDNVAPESLRIRTTWPWATLFQLRNTCFVDILADSVALDQPACVLKLIETTHPHIQWQHLSRITFHNIFNRQE